MANDSIGTARVDLVIDTSQYELALQRAKNSAAGFGEDAERAFESQGSAARRAAKSLLDYVAQLGKSRDEVKLLRAAGAGVDPVIIQAATDAINEYQRGLASTAAETAKLNALHSEALAYDAERTRQQGAGGDFEAQQRAAQAAQRRADATEALSLALMRQDAAEEALKNNDRYVEEERSAQIAWRRAEATEALTLALMREDAAEQAAAGQADFEAQQRAVQQTWRRADATHALTAALEQQEAAERAITSRGEFLRNLSQQEKQVGKTRTELLEMRAAELGLTEQAAPLIASIRSKEAAMGKYNTQLDASKRKVNEYGLSQKQLEFAMRGVPAQITDIAVSLQGGQRPLTVLLQQGGQLKDMFGGVRPAIAALSSELMKFLTPTNLIVGSIAALGIAAYKGASELTALNETAIRTGNNMGATGDRMSAMAAQMAQATGNLRMTTSEALNTAAATGQFTAEQLAIVGGAAALMKRDVGVAIEDTVAEFQKLAKDPVDALVELNKQQHFLTAEVYDAVRALEQQGKTQQAQTLAMREYARVVEERTAATRENVGLLESAWRNLGFGAKWAWDQMMDVGRTSTLTENIQKQGAKIADTIDMLNDARTSTTLSAKNREDAIRNLSKQLADQRAELSRMNRQAADANREDAKKEAAQTANETYVVTQQLIDSQQTKAEQRTRERARVTQDLDKAIASAKLANDIQLAEKLGAQRAAALAAIDKKYADPKQPKGAKGFDDAQRNALQGFKDAADEQIAIIQSASRITDSAYRANTISAADYFAKMKQYSQEETAAREKSITSQIAYLKTSKDSAQARREIGKLEADLAQVRAKSDSDQQVLNQQEATYNKTRKEQMEDYVRALTTGEVALQRQNDARVMALSVGAQEMETISAINKLYQDQSDKLEELAIAAQRDAANSDRYKEQEEALKASTERKVQIVQQGAARMRQAEQDWVGGASRAMVDYLTEANNMSQQTYALVRGGIQTTTSYIDAVMDGTATNFKSFLADLLRQIAKFLMNKAVAEFATAIIGSMGGGSNAGGFSDLFGGDWGFAEGGYTGPGGKYQPAGTVHKGEVVFSQRDVARHGGVAAVEAIRTGRGSSHANGGSPGLAPIRPTGSMAPVIQFAQTINVGTGGAANSNSSGATNAEDRQALAQFGERMRSISQNEIQRSIAPGGDLYNFVRGR